MRILHVIQRYWPGRGGAELHFGELSARLAAEGHAVTVVTSDALDFELLWEPRRRRVPTREETHEGVRVLRFPVRHLLNSSLAYPALRRLLWILSALRPVPVSLMSRVACLTPWMPDLNRWVETTGESFDLVAGMMVVFEPTLEAGLRLARRQGAPFVIYPLTHLGAGPQPAQDPPSRFYTMRHQIDLVRRSDAVAAQTPTEKDFYAARGVPAERITVVGPGVTPAQVLGGDGEHFRRKHGLPGPLVAYLGTLAQDKGAETTIEAVRRLWQAGRQVEIVLAGTVLTLFQQYLDRLPPDVRQRLHVLGPIDEDEKRDLLAACDMLALPSRVDSFGIVFLEAWLYGKPVISARTWGVSDVIQEDENGLLVPFGDAGALAEAMARLIDHPDQAAAMGRQGQAIVYREHTWELKYALVRDLYARVARR